MRPVLFEAWGAAIPSYAVCLLLGFAAAFAVRRMEVERLGYRSLPGHRWVGVGVLLGAMVGSKLGMVLFVPADRLVDLARRMVELDFTGKTVVGGLAGGYVGGLLVRKLVGIRHPTGDAFAVAVPLGMAVSRLGCFLHGCCYGAPTSLPWAVSLGGVARHPAPLYEAVLNLLLAGWLFAIRRGPRPEGRLFAYFLVGYAAIRFGLDFVRGDPVVRLGPLDLVQWVCLAAGLGLLASFLLGARTARQRVSAEGPV